MEPVNRNFCRFLAELERTRIRSQWEDAQNAVNNWSHAEGLTGVGSGDTTLLMATHTTLEIHLSLRYNVAPSPAQFLLQHLVILSWQLEGREGEDPIQREAESELRRAGEVASVLSAGETLCKVINRTVVSRRKKPIELSSRSHRIQIRSRFGKLISRVMFAPSYLTDAMVWTNDIDSDGNMDEL